MEQAIALPCDTYWWYPTTPSSERLSILPGQIFYERLIDSTMTMVIFTIAHC
jgi:hypothetical protein